MCVCPCWECCLQWCLWLLYRRRKWFSWNKRPPSPFASVDSEKCELQDNSWKHAGRSSQAPNILKHWTYVKSYFLLYHAGPGGPFWLDWPEWLPAPPVRSAFLRNKRKMIPKKTAQPRKQVQDTHSKHRAVVLQAFEFDWSCFTTGGSETDKHVLSRCEKWIRFHSK